MAVPSEWVPIIQQYLHCGDAIKLSAVCRSFRDASLFYDIYVGGPRPRVFAIPRGVVAKDPRPAVDFGRPSELDTCTHCDGFDFYPYIKGLGEHKANFTDNSTHAVVKTYFVTGSFQNQRGSHFGCSKVGVTGWENGRRRALVADVTRVDYDTAMGGPEQQFEVMNAIPIPLGSRDAWLVWRWVDQGWGHYKGQIQLEYIKVNDQVDDYSVLYCEILPVVCGHELRTEQVKLPEEGLLSQSNMIRVSANSGGGGCHKLSIPDSRLIVASDDPFTPAFVTQTQSTRQHPIPPGVKQGLIIYRHRLTQQNPQKRKNRRQIPDVMNVSWGGVEGSVRITPFKVDVRPVGIMDFMCRLENIPEGATTFSILPAGNGVTCIWPCPKEENYTPLLPYRFHFSMESVERFPGPILHASPEKDDHGGRMTPDEQVGRLYSDTWTGVPTVAPYHMAF